MWPRRLSAGGEPRFRGIERRFVWSLLGGFAIVLAMMVASGAIALRAADRIDRESSAVSERFLRDTKLVDRLARQQGAIGVLIYSLAGATNPKDVERVMLEYGTERDRTRAVVAEALSEKMNPGEARAWKATGAAAEPLFSEIERLIGSRRHDSADLSKNYVAFTSASTQLMEAAYDDAANSRTAQLTLDAGLFESALRLFLAALCLAGICAAVSVAGSIASFHRIEGQAATLASLSIHTLAEQEEAARRFSKEMHDEFGQLLNAVESNLTVVRPADGPSSERLADSITLVKDAQQTARELSQLLRPRILDDFGLDAGLRELARGFSERTGIVVDYRSNVRERLDAMVETHLFRIAQEALTNTARHSSAKSVAITCERKDGRLSMQVSDDGGGFANPDARGGLGLIGMRERAGAIGGEIDVRSVPGRGVTIRVEAPCREARGEVES